MEPVLILVWSLVLVPGLVWTHKVQEAVYGQNVTLECRGPGRTSLELLQWVRPDRTNEGYVFFYRENRAYRAYQIPDYRDRVDLRDPQMETGDLSIVLRDVQPEDTGPYECRTSDPRSRGKGQYYQISAKVRLVVKGYHQVRSEPGLDVVLPCFGPKRDRIKLVQWSHLDRPGVIYSREPDRETDREPGREPGREPDPDLIQDYRHRVHLRDQQMKDGDAGLVLEKVRTHDSGTYNCIILFTRPGLDQDQTRTEPGPERLEETHHVITLTVSGPLKDPGLGGFLRSSVIGLVFVLVLGLCAGVLVMVRRTTRAGGPYEPYLHIRI